MALKPLKAPRLKPYKPARPNWAPPKRFTTPGGAKPQGYAKYGAYGPVGQPLAARPAAYNWAGAANVDWFPGIDKNTKPIDWTFGLPGAGGGAAAAGQTNAQPDYGSLISGDWEVQDAEAAMAAQMARARGDFQAGLRSQLIDLGISDTSKLGSLGKYIDADTIKAAVANKYSQTAQIAQQESRANAQSRAALAARGLLSSGQTTKEATDITASAESGRYAGLRSFLEGGASGLSGLADMEYGLARGVAQARAAAAARAAEQYQLGAGEGYGMPNEQGFYGKGVFGGPRGTPGQPVPVTQGVSNTALSKQQFMRKNPRGNYYNYLRAWHRHAGTKWG